MALVTALGKWVPSPAWLALPVTAITGRFLSMGFPKPRGGGIAIVSYPFVFRSL